jgi:tetratricopeptide (TPR) repeat protein
MGISKPTLCLVLSMLAGGVAHSREAASAAACRAAAQQPAISHARSAVAEDSRDVRSAFALADAWSEAGCFSEAAQALQEAVASNPGNPQLETRLRVARSLVGEERFFDNIERADSAARLKRDLFRCSSLSDLDACNEAVRLAPTDPTATAARTEALARAGKSAETPPGLASVAPPAKASQPAATTAAPTLASARLSTSAPISASAAPHHYSNAAPEGQSH